jgi:hypothetical protein
MALAAAGEKGEGGDRCGVLGFPWSFVVATGRWAAVGASEGEGRGWQVGGAACSEVAGVGARGGRRRRG